MDTQGVHVEFTITGLSRDVFRSLLEWIWNGLEPLFPIVTGAWSFGQTALIAAPIVALLIVCDLIRRRARQRVPDDTPAGGSNSVAMMASSPKAVPTAITSSAASSPTRQLAPALYSAHAVGMHLVCGPLRFVCRMAMNYIVACVLIRIVMDYPGLIFGIGA